MSDCSFQLTSIIETLNGVVLTVVLLNFINLGKERIFHKGLVIHLNKVIGMVYNRQ